MSDGPENSVITERLLAATAMKTSKFIEKIWRIAAQSVTCKPLFEILLANVCKRHLTKFGVLGSYEIAGTQA
ncbi:hypothetical protein Q7O_003514 [Pectobacterium carotovorum subsp. carotovorum PCCS1]|nr:hypothetical protein [Pectobacterium carotovorum subsp. carotovorum PCCS1]